MAVMDTTNTNFKLAIDFIRNTNRPVFLTGKAGTGKTTFLKYIKEHTNKQTVVVAPTGVAAINAGGVTMHSFFTLPFGPFLPGTKKGFSGHGEDGVNDKHSLIGRLRYNKEKKELLQSLELLIIDEVSMVRSDVLDAIDTILKAFRRNFTAPFGGVQVLFIGDMFQLPPVVKADEWELLQEYYDSPFFFDSLVLKEDQPLHIELEKIYRQSDQHFIDVLNQVRNNQLNNDGMELLHSRYLPDFYPQKNDGYVTLTTHNFKADNINAGELEKLPGKLFIFMAQIKGDFNERLFPAEETLQLKKGAQVMFIKNDVGGVRRYFNGKIGTIKSYDEEDEKIYVQCDDDTDTIEVKKEVWRNIRYSVNKEKQELEEDEIGSFTQYPLRLAWAITIHKSQGLTFEKAIIDAGAAFAPGQVYVALSRCTSLEGLVLHSKINHSSVFTDERITRFARQKNNADQLMPHLNEAKFDYQTTLLLHLFDTNDMVKQTVFIEKFMIENAPFYNDAAMPYVQQLKQKAQAIHQVAQKFQQQLKYYFNEKILPEEHAILQERLKAAAAWFCTQIKDGLMQPLKQSPAKTDNNTVAALFFDALHQLNKLLMPLYRMMEVCKEGFEVDRFLKAKSRTNISMLTQAAAISGPAFFKGKEKSTLPKPDTKKESYELFKAGKTITEIADERKLTTATIETHLGHYVLAGELQLEQVLSKEKIALIMPVVTEIGGTSSAPVKEKIGTAVSYAEVKLVMQWMAKEKVSR